MIKGSLKTGVGFSGCLWHGVISSITTLLCFQAAFVHNNRGSRNASNSLFHQRNQIIRQHIGGLLIAQFGKMHAILSRQALFRPCFHAARAAHRVLP